jgi:hypothetical protein
VLATWPVGSICSPGGGPVQPERKHVKTLRDGTMIVEQLGRCMRVRYRTCHTKCLPPDARIATPDGEVRVRELRAGQHVWTLDDANRRVAAPVDRVASIAITGEHHVARVVLSDGRTFVASPQHPLLGERDVQDLRPGDTYDGTAIVALEFVRFAADRTYDLLPAGPTGVYWVDGVPARSTLGP